MKQTSRSILDNIVARAPGRLLRGKPFLFVSLVALLAAVLLATDAFARQSGQPAIVEIFVDDSEPTVAHDYGEVSARTGAPVALYQVYYPLRPDTPESMARQYLRENAALLKLDSSSLEDLAYQATRQGLSGTTVRFRQFIGGVPVYKGGIAIHINDNNLVTFVTSSYKPGLSGEGLQPGLLADAARQAAHDYLGVRGPLHYDRTALTLFYGQDGPRLAYQVRVEAAAPHGSWEVLVDAHSGELFKVTDDDYYNVVYEENTVASAAGGTQVDGTGYVFDPDPLTSGTADYGDPGFVDGGDNATVQLDGERVLVTLPDIELNTGTYTLRGPNAEVTDWDSPFKGLFQQGSSAFLFDRSDDAFEAANTYYHIDASMRYLSSTLSIPFRPFQYAGGVQFDPHGFGGADNSAYYPGTGRLTFGEGGVDDAEDSDVIHHELGHGLHDWVTAGHISQVNGLSEGIGDYWAQSYNRSIDTRTPADPQYHWVFRWDGHNPFWPGRVTNYGAIWPGGLTGSIHTDGQIWSTCMMKVWDAIGKTMADTAHWEGIGTTGSTTNQSQAANAVYQAAINMGYPAGVLGLMNATFSSCGYNMPPLLLPVGYMPLVVGD